jgi:putative ABC transport system permease protein
LDLARLKYPPQRRYVLYRELLDRIRATPGVEFAASTSIVPISGSRWNDLIEFRGAEKPGRLVPNFSRVSAGYFRTLGTPLLAGRDFNDRDAQSTPQVAIVNESFSRKFLNGANPIGRQFRVVTGPGEPPQAYEIVGLTKDAKYQNLRDDFTPTVFVAASQETGPGTDIAILSRSRGGLGPLLSSLKQTVANVNPGIMIEFQTFESQVQDSLLRERLMATLSGFFGFLAAVLATIGLYGVISYMVARRRNEIGIRIALGADRRNVMNLILGEARILLAIGLVIGIALSVAAARTASAMLYGLRPGDPVTIGLAVALLATVALGASLLPALRAARLEPMMALREE